MQTTVKPPLHWLHTLGTWSHQLQRNTPHHAAHPTTPGRQAVLSVTPSWTPSSSGCWTEKIAHCTLRICFFMFLFSLPLPPYFICVCAVVYVCIGSHVAGTLRQFDALVSHPCALCPTPGTSRKRNMLRFLCGLQDSDGALRGWGSSDWVWGDGSAVLSQVINNGANMHLSRILCIKSKRLIEIGTHPEPFSLPIYPGSRGSHFFQ